MDILKLLNLPKNFGSKPIYNHLYKILKWKFSTTVYDIINLPKSILQILFLYCIILLFEILKFKICYLK